MTKNLRCNYYFETVYKIPVEFYIKNNIKALFVDLDNTLADDENSQRPAGFETWYADITNQNIKLFIVSNNARKERVSRFMQDLPIQWYYRANKQNGKVFRKIMKEHLLEPEDIAVIGDRILTDIVAGNKIGAMTILTKPFIRDKNIFTRFILRPFEQLYVPKTFGVNENE